MKVSSYNKFTARKELLGLKLKNILFEVNSNAIPAHHISGLDSLGDYLQKHSQTYVVLQGFSDNTGPREHNMELSLKRVNAVADYLMEKFNVDEDRIVTLWYGDLNPTADNNTPEGCRLNRRVEIAVGGIDLNR